MAPSQQEAHYFPMILRAPRSLRLLLPPCVLSALQSIWGIVGALSLLNKYASGRAPSPTQPFSSSLKRLQGNERGHRVWSQTHWALPLDLGLFPHLFSHLQSRGNNYAYGTDAREADETK